MENLINVSEVARRLGLSKWTVWRMKALGQLTFYRIGSRVLFAIEDLDQFIQARKIPAKDFFTPLPMSWPQRRLWVATTSLGYEPVAGPGPTLPGFVLTESCRRVLLKI